MTDDAAIHISPFIIHHSDDLLWRQLKTIPAFRAVLRAVESRFYFAVDLPAPTLDVGCGDGHFSQMTFDEPISAGIDPWWNPLKKSRDSGMYDVLAQAMGDELPFANAAFASAFSNSVLEHIPDLPPVLAEVNRVLQMDGRFLITMPSHYFTAWLGGAALFEKIGANGLAEWYRRRFNGISRHEHTDPPEVWAERLAQAGFEIERWQYYFSKEALQALEIGHVQGVPSAITHLLTGHWIVAPWESSLKWTERWLRPYYDETFGDTGAYLLIVARKKANGSIPAVLPPARPFSAEEMINGQSLMINDQLPITDGPITQLSDDQSFNSVEDESPNPPISNPQSPKTNRFPLFLIGLSVLFAMFGQAALGAGATGGGTEGRGGAVLWFGLAGLALAMLAWRQRPSSDGAWQWPQLSHIPERRWWFAPALLLAVLAYRFTAVPGREQPYLALLFWLVGIALGFFALTNVNHQVPISNDQLPIADIRLPITDYRLRTTLLTALLLFLAAVLVRYFQLSQQPAILSGIEASLGLNAVEILHGQIRNPFGTAWLTNPTLPLYLTAVAIRFFGQTIFAVRFVSPIVGGVTVAAMFVIGQRLYGRVVGLAAAILLLGSHLHLHYSRLGTGNVWDPLGILLALGLTAVAWERPQNAHHQRRLWLGAGIFMGLSFYSFTSARLLPLMLGLMVVWALLFARPRLRAQAAHGLAALALALLVALPTLLFYRNNDTIFMERANVLGILDGQTGWLRQEANTTGQSQVDLFQQQFWRSALAFNGREDLSPLYKPHAPLLSFGTAVLYILGFFIALLRFRQLKYAMLIIWLLVTVVFAGALLIESPQSHRLLTAVPAVLFLAAIALAEIGQLVDTALNPSPAGQPMARIGLIIATFAAIFAFSEVAFYYGRYPQTNEFADGNTETATEIARYLNAVEGDATAYFYGPPAMYADFPTFPYLLTDFHKGVNWFDVESGGSLPTIPATHQLFVFLPERFGEVTAVQEQHPGGQLEMVDGRYHSPLFQIYTVPATP